MGAVARLGITNVMRISALVVIVAGCAALAVLFGDWRNDTVVTAEASPHTRQSEQPPFRPVRVVAERPPIEDAPVIKARDVQDEVTDGELVLGVVAGGEARAYPINMLTGPAREIINDTLGGKAIAATW